MTALGGENKGFAMNSWWANYGYFINSAGGSFYKDDRGVVHSLSPWRLVEIEQSE